MRSESSWAGAKRHGEQPARVTVRHKSAERRQEVLRRTRGVASARCRPAVLHPGESLRSCPRLLLSREKTSQSPGLLLVAKTGGCSRHLGGGSQEMLLRAGLCLLLAKAACSSFIKEQGSLSHFGCLSYCDLDLFEGSTERKQEVSYD